MSIKSKALKALVATGAVGTLAVAGAGSAFAAGSGYGPPPGGAPSSVPGGYTAAVASNTISSSGGSVSANSHGDHFNVFVPIGAFATPVQVTLYAPTNLGAVHGVAGISVQLTNPNTGAPVNGTIKTAAAVSYAAAKPFTVTINNPSISSADQVDVYNGSTFVASPTGRTANNVATDQLTSSATLAVVAKTSTTGTTGTGTTGTGTAPGYTGTGTSSSSTGTGSTSTGTGTSTSTGTVTGATSVHTGKPFLGEEILGGALIAAGAAGAVTVARRRRLA